MYMYGVSDNIKYLGSQLHSSERVLEALMGRTGIYEIGKGKLVDRSSPRTWCKSASS